MKSMQIILISAMAVATLLGGCANSSNPAAPISTSSGLPTSSSSGFIGYGVVEDIETIKVSDDGKNITGLLIGGAVGGLLGHQVGSGKGQTAATVAGAVGGAMAGREIEKRSQAASQEKYRVRVRLSNGTTHTVTQSSVSDIKTGDRVRVDNDRVSHAEQ
ncbi:MAG: glycine zipper 2TM domain-containing protein [Candidatus Nitrotoga sp.]|nr:glycine zipper 2TM domain-containing protein [Candidatus Nitrotoga sp.]MDP1856032.1 glycine zipper 2TM domain-containing protein [Candidatus Nitrotoga sp.]